MPSPDPMVVYAEDDTEIRKTMTQIFARESIQFTAAKDGKEALDICLKLLEEQRKIILVTDNEMPRMTGHQLIQILREKESESHEFNIFIILCSGRNPAKELLTLIQHYFQKPFDYRIMLLKIRRAHDCFPVLP
jgi:CheY-like chemotaxis protein